MKHYKIVKKTYYGCDKVGNLNEQSVYTCYEKIIFNLFWVRLHTYSMGIHGSTMCTDNDISFNVLENAENFIKNYHKNRNKIDTYTIETVEKINLTD